MSLVEYLRMKYDKIVRLNIGLGKKIVNEFFSCLVILLLLWFIIFFYSLSVIWI